MRAVVQRVSHASVAVEGKVVGSIGSGLLVLLAAMKGDGEEQVEFLARKVARMRIFTDGQGRMNLDVSDVGGAVLVISQFTLAAPTASGNRPSFSAAMEPQQAEKLVGDFIRRLEDDYGLQVASGVFGARMEVELVNDGPVTIIVDSESRA